MSISDNLTVKAGEPVDFVSAGRLIVSFSIQVNLVMIMSMRRKAVRLKCISISSRCITTVYSEIAFQ